MTAQSIHAVPRSFSSCSFLALILILAACATLPEPEDIRAAVPRVEAELLSLDAEGFAGQVLIALGDEALLLSGYGAMGVDDPRPVPDDAVMPLASITKLFTASALFALAAENRLMLDDPIGHHLPGLNEAYALIPIRSLLNHAAGLPAEIANREWEGNPHFEPVGADVFIARVQQFPPDHRPGRGFNYSNVGYGIAAALIEAISASSWETYLAGSLLDPAGADQIGFLKPGWHAEDLVRSRDESGDQGHYLDQPRLDDGLGWNLRGSGDLMARPGGIMAWWQAVRADTWLPGDWLDRWLEPQIELPKISGYGFGLMFRPTRFGTSIGHTGSQLAFSADLRWYPAHDLLIYVNSAHADFSADQLADRIERFLLAR